jgi:hypothetical protein
MEKKDWKQRLGSYDSWAMNESMFITIDGETIYTLDKLLDFIQQELDKAREEGRREGSEITSRYISDFVKSESGKSGRKEILEYIEELSKLKQ